MLSNRFHYRLLALICTVLPLSGCSTIYYHNGEPPTNERKPLLPFSATQHDGLVKMLSDNPGVELESECGSNGWQLIKTESTFSDIIIRAIANPIWGTTTVRYQCKDQSVAHIENHPNPHTP